MMTQHDPRPYADSAQAREWDESKEAPEYDEWAPESTQERARRVLAERRRQKQVREKIKIIVDYIGRRNTTQTPE